MTNKTKVKSTDLKYFGGNPLTLSSNKAYHEASEVTYFRGWSQAKEFPSYMNRPCWTLSDRELGISQWVGSYSLHLKI
jgi:hypothetical protein